MTISTKGKSLRMIAAVAFLLVPVMMAIGNLVDLLNSTIILGDSVFDYFDGFNWHREWYTTIMLGASIFMGIGCFMKKKSTAKVILSFSAILLIISKMYPIINDFDYYISSIFEAGGGSDFIRGVWEYVFIYITEIVAVIAIMFIIIAMTTDGKKSYMASAVLSLFAMVMAFIDYASYILESTIHDPESIFDFSSYFPFYMISLVFWALCAIVLYFSLFMISLGSRKALTDEAEYQPEPVYDGYAYDDGYQQDYTEQYTESYDQTAHLDMKQQYDYFNQPLTQVLGSERTEVMDKTQAIINAGSVSGYTVEEQLVVLEHGLETGAITQEQFDITRTELLSRTER